MTFTVCYVLWGGKQYTENQVILILSDSLFFSRTLQNLRLITQLYFYFPFETLLKSCTYFFLHFLSHVAAAMQRFPIIMMWTC